MADGAGTGRMLTLAERPSGGLPPGSWRFLAIFNTFHMTPRTCATGWGRLTFQLCIAALSGRSRFHAPCRLEVALQATVVPAATRDRSCPEGFSSFTRRSRAPHAGCPESGCVRPKAAGENSPVAELRRMQGGKRCVIGLVSGRDCTCTPGGSIGALVATRLESK